MSQKEFQRVKVIHDAVGPEAECARSSKSRVFYLWTLAAIRSN
jgi:hypothetical protein